MDFIRSQFIDILDLGNRHIIFFADIPEAVAFPRYISDNAGQAAELIGIQIRHLHILDHRLFIMAEHNTVETQDGLNLDLIRIDHGNTQILGDRFQLVGAFRCDAGYLQYIAERNRTGYAVVGYLRISGPVQALYR